MLRLAAPVLAAGSVYVAGKIMGAVYVAVTDSEPPTADNPETPIGRVIVYAVATAAVTALINVGIQRGVAKATRPKPAEIV